MQLQLARPLEAAHCRRQCGNKASEWKQLLRLQNEFAHAANSSSLLCLCHHDNSIPVAVERPPVRPLSSTMTAAAAAVAAAKRTAITRQFTVPQSSMVYIDARQTKVNSNCCCCCSAFEFSAARAPVRSLALTLRCDCCVSNANEQGESDS